MTSFYRRLLWTVMLVSAAGAVWVAGRDILPKTDVTVRPREDAATTTVSGGTAPENGPVRFLVLGDVMLGRYVRTLMEKEGTDYPFRRIGDFLRDADFVWANLEGPVLHDAPITPLPSLKFAFASNTAELLAENNIAVVSLGNNHALDQGTEGFAQTMEILGAAGVKGHGHPSVINPESETVRTDKGRRIGLIAMNATWPNFKEEDALSAVRRAAAESERVFVAIHWGEEYKDSASPAQRRLARLLLDAGATAVFGHHPHVVQDIELYAGRPIFHSLGNFIFDQYFSEETQEGLAVEVLVGEEVSYKLHPYRIPMSQPELLEEARKTAFLKDLAGRSSGELKEAIEKGEILTRE